MKYLITSTDVSSTSDVCIRSETANSPMHALAKAFDNSDLLKDVVPTNDCVASGIYNGRLYTVFPKNFA